nr:UDP-N-acetylmuramoyl-tripeptide--D-alanyl-D-alanine ligase [Clostridiales bacterium]
MYYAVICSVSALSALLMVMMGCKIMQILQLSSYRVRGVWSWGKRTRFEYFVRYFSAAFFSFASMLMFVGCFWRYRYVRYLGLVFHLFFCVLFIVLTHRQKSKTPLKVTPRIMRLGILSFILCFGTSLGLAIAVPHTLLRYSFAGLLPLAVPLLVLLAHFLLFPFETLNNMRYLHRASVKLQRMPELIRIGITGSYGKTTAKRILAAMLGKKYRVHYSPASYNTPLGIARTVNDSLQGDAEVLIAEMGARYRGDIKELCKLVKPSIGIVTAVGKQHLETFGSIEQTANTKYELIEGLSSSGFGVFSSDNEYTRAMYEKAPCKKVLAGENGEGVFCSCENVRFTQEGMAFELVCGDERVPVTSKLFGRHVPELCALCAAVAFELGVSGADIAEAVKDMEAVEHRLQPIVNGDVTVLDDAYNSNPAGAANALETMQAFDGVRLVITPGFVEMGSAQSEENVAFGKKIAEVAEYAYFIGKNAEALKEGALTGGMAKEKIFVCASRDEAVE